MVCRLGAPSRVARLPLLYLNHLPCIRSLEKKHRFARTNTNTNTPNKLILATTANREQCSCLGPGLLPQANQDRDTTKAINIFPNVSALLIRPQWYRHSRQPPSP